MKPRHQISFKRRRTTSNRPKLSKALVQSPKTADLTSGRVTIGERELNFARALSDTEKPVREESLVALRSWLSEHGKELDQDAIDRLWKALFYCLWMADKRPVITATISNVVELVDLGGWNMWSGALRCMVREWFGVDRHRVNKFYEFLNKLVEKSAKMVSEREEEKEFVAQLQVWLEILDNNLFGDLPRKGVGVALHIFDVYIDRIMNPVMKRAATMSGNGVHKVFDDLLDCVWGLLAKAEGSGIAVANRIHQRVLARVIELVNNEECGLGMKQKRDMVRRVSKKVFAVAAAKETAAELRKPLYELRVDLMAFVGTFDEKIREEKTVEQATKSEGSKQ